MTGILLSGCNGKMGKVITAAAANTDDIEIVGGIDLNTEAGAGYPVFASPTEVTPEVLARTDVIIDFSNPSAFTGLIEFAVKAAKPAVFATTGLNEAQLTLLHHAADKIPVFFAANMSLGVSLISELAQKAAKVLGDDFDIEIVEMHHNQKVDAPSGTALMLADSIKEALGEDMHYEYDRHAKREKRGKNEIGIHSVRGGTITGEHEIIFAGHDEIIKISHSARSKELFATGAINAARFLCGKPAGLYGMKELIG